MIKRIVYILVLVYISLTTFSQQKINIDLKQSKLQSKNTELVQKTSNGLLISESISSFELVEKETKDGLYSQIITEGLSKTFDSGKPDLPVINRLIEIPFNSEVKVKLLSYDEEIIELKNYELTQLIIPAQPSHEKSKDLKDVPFEKDQEVYGKNEFFKKEVVVFEDKGFLRNKHLGYIEISPFAYNPVTNTLKVLNNIKVEISFIPKSNVKPQNLEKLNSPYFDNIKYNTINDTEDTKALISGPVKYIIVSDPMFEETLQEFIEWKTLKGFNVIDAYTDEIGTTTTEIKNYLQDLYDNPEDGVSPTFVLIVGDVAQIPTYSGTAGSHKTDLYYFEYTGDKLPEVFYGRFSAETVAELQSQIDKTLEVEKYEMPDPSYLDNVVLVAGVDGSYAPTYGNGAINYANDYYTNSENGITSYYYLYNDDSGVMASNNSGASASIRSYISAGVSFSNYTAHCGVSGWSDPSFSISHIDALTNEHMYPLLIGNCCQSNTFNSDDCFGEEILIAANKGAVGYIGGSNNTYWDEDYYWGVGLTSSITANPTYEGSGLGAYDRFFHSNGEAKEDWYITQGQINVAGNLAVEASSSSRKAYYWEIYHLMGDPSLTPYVTVPSAIVASYNSEIITGSFSLEVTAEENAYVAVSLDGVLLDAKLVNSKGSIELEFDPLTNVGDLDIVITKQNRQPIIDQVTIVPSSTPYVSLDYYVIDDSEENDNGEVDFGETIKLDVQLKNLSDTYDAFEVVANLSSIDTNITITDSTQAFGTILNSDSSLITASYTIDFKNKFTNQHKVDFDLEILGEDSESAEYTWNSKTSITVNAPSIEIGELLIDDSSENDNGLLDPGETADIMLIVTNNGNATISNLKASANILGDGETYLTLHDTLIDGFSINELTTDTLRFNATADSEALPGTIVYMSFSIDDETYEYYSQSMDKELNIGEILELLITDEDTSIVSKAYFYDSGGSSNEYGDNENDTITLRPADANKYLSVEFISFSVEPNGSGCYDYLEIYDGEDTNADLIGSYCDSNKPTIIVPTNEAGALTFRFDSDGSVTREGWKAEIKSIVGYYFHTVVNGPEGAIEGAIVEFNGRTDTTDITGTAQFNNIADGINYPVKISATGYNEYETTVNILDNVTEDYTLEYAKYDVTFNLSDEEGIIEGDVTFDERTLPTTNGTIIFDDVIYSTDKEFTIQSYGHADSIASIDVTSDLTKNIELETLKHDIEFVITNGTDPISDAVVEFDNKDVLTNIDGIALFEEVKMDTMLSYIVRKTGYNNIEGTIDVEKDSTVNLVLGSGTATFKVAFIISGESKSLYNAQVILDEDTLYTNSEGIAVFNNILEATDIPYKISKTHFNDIVGTVDIAGDNVTIDTTLTYKSYEIVFSIIDGTNPVEGATVNFDGKNETTDSNGDCTFNVTYSLNKDYSITKEGYDELSGKINVDENKTVELSISLITYHVTFAVEDESSVAIENVLVEFNSESKYTNASGECVFDLNRVSGEDYIITLDGYDDINGTTDVNNDTIINVTMNLSVYTVTFVVVDPNSQAISSVKVEFNSITKYTDTNGETVFTEVLPENNITFTLIKDGYWNYDSTINVVDDNVIFNAQLSSTTGFIPIKAEDLKVYPNPSNGLFYIELYDVQDELYQIKVYDVIGSIIYNKEITGTSYIKEQINISKNAKGIYFLSIESNDGSLISRRIIVK
ncbi:C25 family cysteine peptidase [Bacteroidota bacterium]